MSGLTTLLTTAAVTFGVVALAKKLKKNLAAADAAIQEQRRKAAGAGDRDVLDFEKNPKTGAYEAQGISKTDV